MRLYDIKTGETVRLIEDGPREGEEIITEHFVCVEAYPKCGRKTIDSLRVSFLYSGDSPGFRFENMFPGAIRVPIPRTKVADETLLRTRATVALLNLRDKSSDGHWTRKLPL